MRCGQTSNLASSVCATAVTQHQVFRWLESLGFSLFLVHHAVMQSSVMYSVFQIFTACSACSVVARMLPQSCALCENSCSCVLGDVCVKPDQAVHSSIRQCKAVMVTALLILKLVCRKRQLSTSRRGSQRGGASCIELSLGRQ